MTGAVTSAAPAGEKPEAALFVTCLVDLFRPGVAFAAIELLERAGFRVAVPEGQTCCGQPGYNGGDREAAIALAKRTVALLEGHERIVVPSGSCAGMIRHHYPLLLAASGGWAERARSLAARVFELTEFLAAQGGVAPAAPLPLVAAYHDSCSALREMGITAAPRALLAAIPGLSVRDLADREACCGFGGTFCLKFAAIAADMADRKIADAEATGADLLLAGDLGCLLHLAGRLSRRGGAIACRHVAEVLAGRMEAPAIGESGRDGAHAARRQ